jgi:hypothetical protein
MLPWQNGCKSSNASRRETYNNSMRFKDSVLGDDEREMLSIVISV